ADRDRQDGVREDLPPALPRREDDARVGAEGHGPGRRERGEGHGARRRRVHEHADQPDQAVDRAMRRHERVIVAAAVLGLFGLWEALARAGRIDASLAPAPSTILGALVRLLERPEVLASLAVTAWEAVAAFLIAVPVGLLIGFTLAEIPGL